MNKATISLMKIVITGGGTGGHIYPALAVATELQKQHHQIEWIGSRNGMEKEIVMQAGIKFHGIFTGKLRRYFDWQNFTDLFRIIYGFVQARDLLRKIRPQVVFSKGGYTAVPVAVAAISLHIPVVTHESDATPGLATRIINGFGVDKICLGFASLKKYFSGDKIIMTGTPINKNFFIANKEDARKKLGIKNNEHLLVVIGGSQGALSMNKLIFGALPKILSRAKLIHQTGQSSVDQAAIVKSALPKKLGKKYTVITNIEHKDMANILSAADLVIARAGATALAELAACKKACILIPLPTFGSRGDQLANAEFLAKQKAAVICYQDKTSSNALGNKISELLRNKQLRDDLSKNIGLFSEPKALEKIVGVIESINNQ
ncbi:MAG: undecaprenyldiphospho-muramoylpentapeptide beta-N-acetylglucosaminyltransferase [Patescibacteria group bacterium]|nr:undecaprenyldiphospho-muramoylpentapeptide beta-N-acetylglucosaminyltransferase [Patescibacteria group bacterium]